MTQPSPDSTADSTSRPLAANKSSPASQPSAAGDEIHVSSEISDPDWDDFLRKDPLGQFRQCSAWAHAKASENWRLIRAVLPREGRIAGGFQLLWRDSRVGRIGYISKGPVAAGDDLDLIQTLTMKIRELAKSLRLRAVIVQPPDFSTCTEAVSERLGFVPNRVVGVITATLLLDLTKGIDAIREKFRRRTRQEVAQARKRGITIRVGGRDDIETFFSLMQASCARQGKTSPNPSSAAGMTALWEAFNGQQAARLTIAEFEGQPVAGLFCILFGGRLSFWKKGSDLEHQNRHPMSLLYDEALAWGAEKRCALADWIAIDRETAEAILAGRPLLEDARRSRHFYNLGFGTSPKLLPKAKIWFPNIVARRLYQGASHFSLFKTAAHFLDFG